MLYSIQHHINTTDPIRVHIEFLKLNVYACLLYTNKVDAVDKANGFTLICMDNSVLLSIHILN